MPSTTPLAGWTIPSLSDAANGPSAFSTLAGAIEKQVTLVYASTAARDAAIPSPVAGMEVWTTAGPRLYRYDGTGWVIMAEPDQTDATPSLTGVTIGNGVWTTAQYHRHDGWIDIGYVFTLGTTSAVTGTITFNLPIAAKAGYLVYGQLNVTVFDTSAGVTFQGASGVGTTDPAIFALNSAGTYVTINAFSALIPMTWATGDQIIVSGRYPMTTRYS